MRAKIMKAFMGRRGGPVRVEGLGDEGGVDVFLGDGC